MSSDHANTSPPNHLRLVADRSVEQQRQQLDWIADMAAALQAECARIERNAARLKTEAR